MSDLLRTKVADTGLTQLIQRLGRECTPTQFMREFVQNAIEATSRTDDAEKKILVDVDWEHFEQTGIYKISFIDTGDGMTGDEMLLHLNNLSSSGHSNNFENYGVGAKISALTRNHEGILYRSWKGGFGHEVLIRYDADAQVYGVHPVITEDGIRLDAVPLSEKQKHPLIGEHGTEVTLLGMAEDEETMAPPTGVRGGREYWIIQYLNTRYFEIPECSEIQVRVGYFRDRENKKHNCTRRIDGQRKILDANKVHSDCVQLSDAKVHFWILEEGRKDHARQFTKGHTGCLNQNELFDISTDRASKAAGFGITFGRDDVVLYVEPNSKYLQNTARTGLVQVDGSPLPWDRWQDEFRAKMPKELSDFIKSRMGSGENTSHEESIRGRLKSIAQFFKISRYRSSVTGTESADPDSQVMSGIGQPSNEGQGGGAGARRTNTGNAAGARRASLLADLIEQGVLAEAVSPDKFPTVQWVSLADKSRSKDELDDRAAVYHSKDNLIKANADFQGFTDIIAFYCEQYEEVTGAENVIKDVVQEAFEQQLVEVVTGASSLKNRPKWTPADFEEAVSEESLTASVMPRYHLMKFIRQGINKALGKASVNHVA